MTPKVNLLAIFDVEQIFLEKPKSHHLGVNPSDYTLLTLEITPNSYKTVPFGPIYGPFASKLLPQTFYLIGSRSQLESRWLRDAERTSKSNWLERRRGHIDPLPPNCQFFEYGRAFASKCIYAKFPETFTKVMFDLINFWMSNGL